MLRAPEVVVLPLRPYGDIWVETIEAVDGEIRWYDRIYKERMRPNGLKELCLVKIIPSTRPIGTSKPPTTYKESV